jgi:glutamate/tyrosine decarboxylase-like PLP-dependent enzyme
MDRVTGDRTTATGVAGTPPETIGSLVERLRAVAGALADRLPEVHDGETWVHVDAALACLHGALIELEDLDDAGRRPVGSGGPILGR